MTRPKVPEEKRQRTAQACDSCKRRKQKCNGMKPCGSCAKRGSTCVYATNSSNEIDSGSRNSSSAKKRNTDEALDHSATASSMTPSSLEAQNSNEGQTINAWRASGFESVSTPSPLGTDTTTASQGQDEFIEVYGQVRMLEDSNGGLLFVGDSSTLSYLQFMRTVVESPTDTTLFSGDPIHHIIPDNSVAASPNLEIPCILPDKEAVKALADVFFTNTHGVVEILDRMHFEMTVDAYYLNPVSVHPSDLCSIYLTLATALVMVVSTPGTQADFMLGPFASGSMSQAEVLFKSAMRFGESLPQFSDGDLWSVQTHALIALFKFSVSKWNAAYASLAKAVSFAVSLGLHQVDAYLNVFQDHEVVAVLLRRNIWRSLFVLDRLMSEFLGRPTVVSDDNGSLDALRVQVWGNRKQAESLDAAGLNATVAACRAMGHIIGTIYTKSRQVSVQTGQELLDECLERLVLLPNQLQAERIYSEHLRPWEGLVILHTNLLETHCQLLATRPFFLYLLYKMQDKNLNNTKLGYRPSPELEKLSESCLDASRRVITMLRAAHSSDWLPRRNAFMLNFLLAAGLVLYSNEFSGIHENEEYRNLSESCIQVAESCAGFDALGSRVFDILSSFHSLVQKQGSSKQAIYRGLANQGSSSTSDTALSSVSKASMVHSEIQSRRMRSGDLRRHSGKSTKSYHQRSDDLPVPYVSGAQLDGLGFSQSWNMTLMDTQPTHEHTVLPRSDSVASLSSQRSVYPDIGSYHIMSDPSSNLPDMGDDPSAFSMRDVP